MEEEEKEEEENQYDSCDTCLQLFESLPLSAFRHHLFLPHKLPLLQLLSYIALLYSKE